MSITYGLPVRPKGDPWVRMVEESFTITDGIGPPGKYLVDILPFLKYVPSWMPGAQFKRDAKHWNALLKESVDKPFEAANQAMVIFFCLFLFCFVEPNTLVPYSWMVWQGLRSFQHR